MLIKKRFRYCCVILIALICFLSLNSCKYFEKKKPNVIFLMLDTLRADHLGAYGYERNTSPHLDRFAKENLFFKHAITAVPWTPPSVAGMLSGLYPASHGFLPPNSREEATTNVARLSAEVLTLPEILKAQGYQTYAISSNPWITDTFGFDQGFDQFEYLAREQADVMTESGIKAMQEMKTKEEPFFLYLHYLDPHDPYSPPDRYARAFKGPLKSFDYNEKMQKEIGLYDGEIAFLDERLGHLFSFLRENDLYEDSVIVIIGDHGEQFLEHGDITHGNQLVNPELHVPLMIKTGKEIQQRTVDFAVSTIDVFPTILELVGLTPPANYQSISLLKDENSLVRGGVISEIYRKYNQRSFTNHDGKRLLIGSRPMDLTVESNDPYNNVIGIYDAFTDTWEQNSIQDTELLKQLQLEFKAEFEKAITLKVKQSAGASVDQETIDQLESLGYLK